MGPGPRRILLSLLAIMILASGAPPGLQAQDGQGIGVSPSTLRVDDPPLVRGGTMERELVFQQHDHDTAEVEIRVLPPGRAGAIDASAWVTLDPAGVQTIPRTSEYPVQVLIDVPAEAANGDYEAKVEFRVLKACDADGSCAALQTAASARLVLTVSGEQVKQIRVAGSPQLYDAERQGDLQYRVPIENVGNVIADPHVRLQIYDKHQRNVLLTHWANDTRMRPGETGMQTYLLRDIALPEDQYWGVITVYLDDAVVAQLNPQTFDVLLPGSLSRDAVLRTLRIDGDLTQAAVGDLVKLEAVVQNTGQAPVMARFKGEVWVDGKLVRTIESDELEIPIGATTALPLIYEIQEPGRHEFKGRANYHGKLTEEKVLLLQVVDTSGGTGMLLWGILGALGAAAAVLVIVVVSRRGARQQRRRGPPAGSRRRPPAGRGRPAGRPPASGGQRPVARRGPAPARGRPPAQRGPGAARPGAPGRGAAPPRRR